MTLINSLSPVLRVPWDFSNGREGCLPHLLPFLADVSCILYIHNDNKLRDKERTKSYASQVTVRITNIMKSASLGFSSGSATESMHMRLKGAQERSLWKTLKWNLWQQGSPEKNVNAGFCYIYTGLPSQLSRLDKLTTSLFPYLTSTRNCVPGMDSK